MAECSWAWCELVEGAVRPCGVVVPQVLGQDLAQVVLADDPSRSRTSRRRAPIILPQMAFAQGAGGGLARIEMPSV
ncbi:MAG TPA: hypothetical protein VIJ82_22280 [Streptosporangiaceae bacterium]